MLSQDQNIQVTAVDLNGGEGQGCVLAAGQYVVVCAEPRYTAGEECLEDGTVVVTLKVRDQVSKDARPKPDERYFCPTSGDVESPRHGGFDVCCDRPELHRPVTAPNLSEQMNGG